MVGVTVFNRKTATTYIGEDGRRYTVINDGRSQVVVAEGLERRSWAPAQGLGVGVLALITGLVLGLGFSAFILAVVLGAVVYAARRPRY
jgi:hypothetical protein